MFRALQTLALTQKKSLNANKQTSERVQEARQDYRKRIGLIPAQSLVFLDKSGVSVRLRRPYGRSPRGQRCHATAPVNWPQTIAMSGPVALAGMVAPMVLSGPRDGACFLAYGEQILVPALCPGQVVVMDNLSVQKVDWVLKAIESAGCEVCYLAPYSPGLKLIENRWSKVEW